MEKVFIRSTNDRGYFYRCGHRWTSEGEVVDPKDWTDAQQEVLANEPNLQVRPATEAEIAGAAPAASAEVEGDDLMHDELMRVIPLLPVEAFGKGGAPKLDALREAAEVDPALITSEARDAALEALLKGGFVAPTASND